MVWITTILYIYVRCHISGTFVYSSDRCNVDLCLSFHQSAVIYFFITYAYRVTSARGDGFGGYIYEFSSVSSTVSLWISLDVTLYRSWFLPLSRLPTSSMV